MKRKDLSDWLLFVGTLLLSIDVTKQLTTNGGKKYPAYSLQNMPKTDFSCRDKILGGYYADADTQCQMFHVCVKVAGVGVRDFRFLCPNGTAFDQEAQTCADFGDVGCEQATLYYGSDNFDLYRIGSGFETKQIPAAVEEESTFHLQRAESNDLRRSKEHTKPSYNFGTSFNSQQQSLDVGSVKPAKQYQPHKLASTTTSSTTTIQPSNYVEPKPSSTAQPYLSNKATPLVLSQSKPYVNSNHNDEIFKGSHSSNFYSSRNSNDDDDDYNKHNRNQKTRQRQRGRTQYRGTPFLIQNYTTPRPFSTTNASPSPSPSSQFRFILSSTIRSTATPANGANQILTSAPLGPLQQQYHQPIYNNNFANFRTYATTSSTTKTPLISNQNFRNNNFNQIYTTPATFGTPQRPVVSVPTPFNSHNNANANNLQFSNSNGNKQNQFFDSNSSSITGKQQQQQQQPNKTFDNHNPINNYQTTSPFANHQPFYTDINQKQVFPLNYTNTVSGVTVSASTRLTPSAPNHVAFNQQNVQSNRNQRTNNNNERVPTTITPQIVTTQNTLSRSTFRPNFSQQDFLNQFTLEQQKLNQKKPQSQPLQNENTQNNNNRNAQSQPSFEQKRLQLHYDINDYLSTNKYTPENQYSPTSEQYRSVQTYSQHPNADYSTKQNKKQVESYTQKYAPPKQASQSQSPFVFQTTTVSNKPQFEQFSFNAPINVQNAYQSAPTQAPIVAAASTNQNVIPQTIKKFSTLVPKDNYAPTTFKPSFYFNVAKQINDHLSTPAKQIVPSTTTSTTTVRSKPINYSQQHFVSSTPNIVSFGGIDENDGQYHPELYERDFARYKIKSRKKHQHQQQFNVNRFQNAKNYVPNVEKNVGTSTEEEILNTAHSQNIAATGNELWAANSKKAANSKQSQSNGTTASKSVKYSAPIIPLNATTTKKPKSDEDVSYDYAYYDSGSNDSHNEYSELEVIDFGKTKNQ